MEMNKQLKIPSRVLNLDDEMDNMVDEAASIARKILFSKIPVREKQELLGRVSANLQKILVYRKSFYITRPNA